MAELRPVDSLTLEELRTIFDPNDPTIAQRLPRLYRIQAQTRLQNLQDAAKAREIFPSDRPTAERVAEPIRQRVEAARTAQQVREAQIARQIEERLRPQQVPPATATPEDLTSQAMRAVLPPPTLPPGPAVPPDVEQPPGGSRAPMEAPSSAPPEPPQPAPSSGMRAAPTQVGESGEARRARAMGETAELMKGLQEPERKPSIMDSPYTAIINAGLNMLMNAAGRSPLEAIAGGASAGLKTAQEQAMREEARGEKQLERAYKRAEMGVKLRTELQRVEQEEEKLRAEYEKIKNQREHYASTAAHQNAMLAVQERLAKMGERRNDINEGLLAERERAGTRAELALMSRTLTPQLSELEKTIRELEVEMARTPLPAEKTRIQQRITQYEARAKAIRDELAELQQRTPRGGPQPQPARPTSPM